MRTEKSCPIYPQRFSRK